MCRLCVCLRVTSNWRRGTTFEFLSFDGKEEFSLKKKNLFHSPSLDLVEKGVWFDRKKSAKIVTTCVNSCLVKIKNKVHYNGFYSLDLSDTSEWKKGEKQKNLIKIEMLAVESDNRMVLDIHPFKWCYQKRWTHEVRLVTAKVIIRFMIGE